MKHTIRILLATLACAVFIGPLQAATTTFKIATVTPAGTDWMKQMKQAAKSITEKTEGRVGFKFYPGGVMGSEQTVLRKIRNRQLQGGAFSSGGLADIYPDIQLLNLPMLFDSYDEVDYVRARMEPVMRQNLEARGFVLLGVAEEGFTHMLSNKPIKNLASIREQKLWAPEGDLMVAETWRSMGLSPVFLPIQDVYTGLQTGLVDAVTITPIGAIAFQWQSNLGYMTDTPLAYLVGLLAIKKSDFDKISTADQAIVRQEIAQAVETLDKMTREGNRQATEALKSQGFEIVEPDDEEIAHLRWLADKSLERLIEKGALTEDGIKLVKHYLCDYRYGSRQ